MKIAFVYDRVNKFGGAERVLLALHKIWPQAPLYTAVYNREKAEWADVFKVNTTFLNRFSFMSDKHEILALFTPVAFESLSFESYDIVLSIASADAKGISTSPKTLHVCYCLTPTRYLWSGFDVYRQEPGVGLFNGFARSMMNYFFVPLRLWDYVAAQRPDYYIAISNHVAKRIRKYYNRYAQTLYPPVDTSVFRPKKTPSGNYFLVVSRLVPYKRIDYVIKAFNRIKKPLIIIGNGSDKSRLKSLAGKTITFIDGNLTDEKLAWYYRKSRALIFGGEEDFGLTSVEVQACGRPVIALATGGVSESIIPSQTGELYDIPTVDSLLAAVTRFEQKYYDSSKCTENARRFAKDTFQNGMKSTIEKLYKNWKKGI